MSLDKIVELAKNLPQEEINLSGCRLAMSSLINNEEIIVDDKNNNDEK